MPYTYENTDFAVLKYEKLYGLFETVIKYRMAYLFFFWGPLKL